jgi:hypothetical protein
VSETTSGTPADAGVTAGLDGYFMPRDAGFIGTNLDLIAGSAAADLAVSARVNATYDYVQDENSGRTTHRALVPVADVTFWYSDGGIGYGIAVRTPESLRRAAAVLLQAADALDAARSGWAVSIEENVGRSSLDPMWREVPE